MAASSDRGNERAAGADEAEEEVKTDGWLTTYADMVTLMLTFFVLLFALSNSDTEKIEMFLIALSRDGITAEQFWEIKDKYEELDDMDYDSWDDSFPFPGEDDEWINPAGAAAMEELATSMTEYIEDEELGEVFTLTFNGEMLLMTLQSDIMFESGSAELTEDMKESAAAIARMFAATYQPGDPFEIVVAGHTDNVPINTPQYPSNWHLSDARATNFLYELVSGSELNPAIFYSRACGEYRPIASNDTDEGKQKNRRIEVMVSLARDNPRWQQDEGMLDNWPVE